YHEIERQEAQQRGDRQPQPRELKEPPSAAGGEQRRSHGGGRNEDAHGEHVDGEDSEIARPARPPGDGKRAARGNDLPRRHGGEDEGEGTDANQVLEVHRRRQITKRPRARGLLVYRPSGLENLAHGAGQTPHRRLNEVRRTPRSTAESGSARQESHSHR